MEAEYIWPVKEDGVKCKGGDGWDHTLVGSKTNRHFEGNETDTVTTRWTCQHCLVEVDRDGKIVRKPGLP